MIRKVAVAVCLSLLLGGLAAAEQMVKTSTLGPLPPQALLLPAQPDVMMGLDVKGLFASTLVTKLRAGDVAGLPIPPEQSEELKKNAQEGFDKFLREGEEGIGVRLDRDVDTLVLSVSNTNAKEPEFVGLVLGRFDRAAIAKALTAEAQKKNQKLETRTVAGTTLYLAGGPDKGGVAVLDERTVVFGGTAALEAIVARHARHEHALDANRELMGRISALKPSAGFWLLAEKSLMDKMTEKQTQPPPMPVPNTFSMTMEWDAGVEMAAQMANEEAARNLADVIQGGIGMMRMKASQDPEMQKTLPGIQDMMSGITVKAEGTAVRLALNGKGGGAAGMGIMAAIAIPSLLRARMSANEAAAIGDLRTVISAQAAYNASNGGAYAQLSCLAAPATCIKGYQGPTFLGEDLGSLKDKSGYKRKFHPGKPGKRLQSLNGYAYTATPLEPGKTGVRSFCGDDSGVICFNAAGADFAVVDGKCPAGCVALK